MSNFFSNLGLALRQRVHFYRKVANDSADANNTSALTTVLIQIFSVVIKIPGLARFSFSLKNRLKFYRILSKATDEHRTGLKTVMVIGQLADLERKSSGIFSIKYHLYQEWFLQLNRGASFSHIARNVIPPAETMIIAACEHSGKISDGFKLASNIAKSQATFSKIFRNALAAPIINFIVAIGLSAMFCLQILPQLANSIDPKSLSQFSRNIVWLCNNYYTVMTALLAVVMGVVIGVVLLIRYYVDGYRLILDKFPPFSMYRITTGCAFLFVMNTLAAANIQQTEALRQMRLFAGNYLRYRIDKILALMNRGISFGQALIDIKLNFPDKMIIDELSMYSLHGNVDDSLNDIIESMSEDAIELITLQAEIIKNLTIAMVAFVVTFLASGLYSLITDMAQTA